MDNPVYLDRHTLRELILDFYTTYDSQRLRDGIDINGMVNWTFQNGLSALNEMLYKNYNAEIDPHKRLNSNTRDAFKRVSAALVTPVQFTEDEGKRQQILEKLRAFYTKYDQSKLNSLQKLVDFAMYRGVELLNHKLMDKYGENLDSFNKARVPPPVTQRRPAPPSAAFSEESGPPPPKAINIRGHSFTAVKEVDSPPTYQSENIPRVPSYNPPPPFEDDNMTVLPPPPPIEDFVDPDTIEEELRKFYTYHDPGKLDVVDALAAWVMKIGRLEFNNKLDQLYGATLDDEIPEKKQEEPAVMMLPPATQYNRPATPPPTPALSEVSPIIEEPEVTYKPVVPQIAPPPMNEPQPVIQRVNQPPPVTPRVNPAPPVAPRYNPPPVVERPVSRYDPPAPMPTPREQPVFTKPTYAKPPQVKPPVFSPPAVKPTYAKPTPKPAVVQTPKFAPPPSGGRQPSILGMPSPNQKASDAGLGFLSSNAFKSHHTAAPVQTPATPKPTPTPSKQSNYVPQGVSAARSRFESKTNKAPQPGGNRFGGGAKTTSPTYPKPSGYTRKVSAPTYPVPTGYAASPRVPKPTPSYNSKQPTYAKPSTTPTYSRKQPTIGKTKPPPPKQQPAYVKPNHFGNKAQTTASNANKGGACNNYKLDMTGKTFGVCVCGEPRASHKRR